MRHTCISCAGCLLKFTNLVCTSAGPGASLPNGSAAPRDAHSYPSAPHSGPDAPHINGGYHGGHVSARGADPAGSAPLPPPPPPPLGHVLGSGGEAGPGLRLGPRYGGESESGWRAFAGVAGERGASSRGPGGLLGAHAQLPSAAEAVWHFNGERAPAQVREPSSSSFSCGPLLLPRHLWPGLLSRLMRQKLLHCAIKCFAPALRCVPATCILLTVCERHASSGVHRTIIHMAGKGCALLGCAAEREP